jgi:hypothetical protein
MAFRIHDSVVRGEIDNRQKGKVQGRIWVEGCAEPVILELAGNAWPDLAGCLLTFTNPKERRRHPHLDSLAPLQQGTIGDLTASRKVRVFDVPLEEALAMIRRQEKPPEHLANSLYVEWFSGANGRVVIESADYQLEVSAPEWRLTPDEDAERAQQAAHGMVEFMQRLTDAVEAHQHNQKDPEEEWDEYDYEKFLKESDARTEKYLELLDKYGDSRDAQDKIAREMGWRGDGEDEDDQGLGISEEEMNEICEAAANEPPPEPDPSREGIDWIRTEDGEIRHPLQHRCAESVIKLWRACDQLGLDKCSDTDLEQFVSEFQITSAKLAGALCGIAEGQNFCDDALTVAYLKRALDHLHKSQAGLKAVAPKKLLPESVLRRARQDLFEIRESILKLMDEFRGRR